MDVLNNVTAPDNAPTAASTLDGLPGYSRAIIDVLNAAVYWQARTGTSKGDAAAWLPAGGVFMTPGSRRAPLSGKVYGFRFWAATPAAQLPTGSLQAHVTVTLV